MKVELSESVQRQLKSLFKKDLKLFRQIQKQLKNFRQNPTLASLRIHKLSGRLDNSYSLSINRKFRMIYTLTPESTAYFFDLGTHDEVYRK